MQPDLQLSSADLFTEYRLQGPGGVFPCHSHWSWMSCVFPQCLACGYQCWVLRVLVEKSRNHNKCPHTKYQRHKCMSRHRTTMFLHSRQAQVLNVEKELLLSWSIPRRRTLNPKPAPVSPGHHKDGSRFLQCQHYMHWWTEWTQLHQIPMASKYET